MGIFPFQSGKAEHRQNATQCKCLAHIFVLRVLEVLDSWPESQERQRLWVRCLLALLFACANLCPPALLFPVPACSAASCVPLLMTV